MALVSFGGMDILLRDGKYDILSSVIGLASLERRGALVFERVNHGSVDASGW